MAAPTNAAQKRDLSPKIEHPDAPAQKLLKVEDAAKATTHRTVVEPTKPGSTACSDGNESIEKSSSHSTKNSDDAASKSSELKGKSIATAHVKGGDDIGDDIASPVKEHIGDLFEAPPDTVLVHACNTVGSWGGGIAVEFRKRYPKAFEIYKHHCVNVYNPKTNPVPKGTCLLIPPSEVNSDAPQHWIGCLFTSAKYGRSKDPPNVILNHTGPAFLHLLFQINRKPIIREIRMCQINSGLFNVPWSQTKKVVEDILAAEEGHKEVHVYSLATVPKSSHGDFVGLARRKLTKKSNKGSNPQGQLASEGQGNATSRVQSTLNSFVRKH